MPRGAGLAAVVLLSALTVMPTPPETPAKTAPLVRLESRELAYLNPNGISFQQTFSVTQRICKKVTGGGITRNVCGNFTFTNEEMLEAQFCFTTKIKGKSKKYCKTYFLKPTVVKPGTTQPTVDPNKIEIDPNAPPLPDAPAGTYVFSNLDANGLPVKFEPCATIPWSVRGTDAEMALTRLGIEILASTTRLTFKEVAPDSYRPLLDDLPKSPTVTGIAVAWYDESQAPELAGNVAGLTHSQTWTQGNRQWRSFSGIGIERQPNDPLVVRGGLSAWVVLIHELGHAVGLGHVEDKVQIMYPSTHIASADIYQNGDLAGLARLGKGNRLCR